MHQKTRTIGVCFLIAVWAVLAAFAWFSPAKKESQSERRPLKQWPALSAESLWKGKFMKEFESYSLDQFPLRDSFRECKSVFHYYVLQQKDNNDIYINQGYAAKMEYPLNQTSLTNAINHFQSVYDQYLKQSSGKILLSVVPDKSYYLAEPSGHLRLDYEAMFKTLQEALPWAQYVDITDSLELEDYYRTDTHWKQENLIPVAQKLANALDISVPEEEAFRAQVMQEPFYGVYYGQAALPMQPDTITLLQNNTLDTCKVFDYETNQYGPVYATEKLAKKDPYEVYLSGARALLTIENPLASTNRELIIFRDSFGSSITPLLVQDYAKVTLVDIRYISSALLGDLINFQNKDVLFLYSTLVLNSSSTFK